MSKVSENNKFRTGQGDAFKSSSEVAFLAEQIEYIGFVHNYPKANIKGKFIIPALIPLLKSSVTVEETTSTSVRSSSTGDVISGQTKKTNFVIICIPFTIANKFIQKATIKQYGWGSNETDLYVQIVIPKDTEFTVNFVGDDINKVRLVGVNERVNMHIQYSARKKNK